MTGANGNCCRIVIQVDGGCRGNGTFDAIGAAAAIIVRPRSQEGKFMTKELRCDLDREIPVTNSRAELEAMILGLQFAKQKYDELPGLTFHVTIQSDSEYTIKLMSHWIFIWSQNGWRTTNGRAVANLDLVQRAMQWHNRIDAIGNLKYDWVPRTENTGADGLCNRTLARMGPHWNTR